MARSVVERPCSHGKGFTFSTSDPNVAWKSSSPERFAAAHRINDSVMRPINKDEWPRETFPEPLVLPGDALDVDYFEVEKDDAQTFTEWFNEKDRNPVTSQRRTIYIAAPPKIDKTVAYIGDWKKPQTDVSSETAIQHPQLRDVMRYLAAFYWPLPVKQGHLFEFTSWNKVDVESSDSTIPKKKSKANIRGGAQTSSTTQYIALCDRASGIATRITTRPAPPGHPFSRQVSTTDIIDSLIQNLPHDAYAVVLLLEHDLYEDDDDDFIIGRAYGGSRVAVVSMARYNPVLDAAQSVERLHSWPLSHCVEYVRSKRGKVARSQAVQVKSSGEAAPSQPMMAAIAYALAQDANGANSTDELKKLWLNRVCRTASHELGHCFALDHCMYYACIMQSSGNAAEDARQPGYLCPVDLCKLLEATNSKGRESELCRKMADVCAYLGPGGGFGALGAWMEARITELADTSRSTEAAEVILID